MPAQRCILDQWVFYVYILTNKNRTVLYIGVTKSLEKRLWQHRERVNPQGFAARYRLNRLVHFEKFSDIRDAIAREKELKGWRRSKKDALISENNLGWEDQAVTMFGFDPVQNQPFDDREIPERL